jgi:hypothetical protein
VKEVQDIESVIETLRRKASDEVEALVRSAVERMEISPEGLAKMEKGLRERMHGLGASILGAAMGLAGNGYTASRQACECGSQRKYVNDRERDVVSLLGKFRLKRAYYWCARCGKSEAPLDRQLGILSCEFTPAVRELIGRLGAQAPFDQGRDLMGQLAGIWISKRKHEEIAEGIGARLDPEAPASVDLARVAPQSVEALYLMADGTTAPTLEGWREVKIGAVFHAHTGKDGLPERGATRYFGDVIEAETFGWRWYRQASAMGLDAARRVVVLGDGAAWIWGLAEMHFPGAIQIVDWYHATERLWNVAHAAFGQDNPKARAWGQAGEQLLSEGKVELLLRRISRLRPQGAESRNLCKEAQGYFKNNARRMRYGRFRRQGLFIGSGIVEAGCKHIVGARLKQSGMRWSLSGLRSILQLRLALRNGDWPHAQAA